MLKDKFSDFLKKNLNKAQAEAVKQKEGPMLVIAGAGSGKTRIITSRITNLILNEDIQPESIIALTFTNKAAQEMKDRINSWLPANFNFPFLGTFHSFCLKILKNNNSLIEIPNFSILDDDDQLKMIQSIVQKFSLNKKENVRQLQYNISLIKNNLALAQGNFFTENKILQEIYLAYENERKISKCYDFDDLIIETVKLFKNNKNFKNKFQDQISHVLVDEYQDTSIIQHELLKQISLNYNKEFALKSLCVVGDEDQSIYSWRGATVENIVLFNKDFSNTKMIKIEQNYRSVQPILEIANKVISNNKNRNPKKLWSEKQARNRILNVTCTSEYKEGEMIAQAIKIIEKNKLHNSMGILYRTHFQSRAIEEALIKNSIPYKIIGGIQFYERKEIKDIIAYLKLAINPFDRISFFRIINCPARKLGQKFEEEFYIYWSNEPFLNFHEIAKKLINKKVLTKIKEDSLSQFLHVIEKLQNNSPVEAINNIIIDTNYINYLKDNFDRQEAETKIENVKEFLRAAHHYQEQNNSNSISNFIEEITLMQQKIKDNNEAENNVQLMTLHAAKGLEFDIVFIPGIEEGILPSKKSTETDNDMEEERRLFYVGITRAREYLILSNAKYRNSFGQTNVQSSSRFLQEVPGALVHKEDASSYFSTEQFSFLFAEFFGYKTIKSNKKQDSDIKLNYQSCTKWKQNSPVIHELFGTGIIQKIENRENKILITVKFKSSTKKIDSKFLKTI